MEVRAGKRPELGLDAVSTESGEDLLSVMWSSNENYVLGEATVG
jgi:hypothetical protein